eukprot:1158967-Pelagomonas_calceolata.AAC.8
MKCMREVHTRGAVLLAGIGHLGCMREVHASGAAPLASISLAASWISSTQMCYPSCPIRSLVPATVGKLHLINAKCRMHAHARGGVCCLVCAKCTSLMPNAKCMPMPEVDGAWYLPQHPHCTLQGVFESRSFQCVGSMELSAGAQG